MRLSRSRKNGENIVANFGETGNGDEHAFEVVVKWAFICIGTLEKCRKCLSVSDESVEGAACQERLPANERVQ